MKKNILALSLLVASGFSTSAFAESTINFNGAVNGNTCSIDIDGAAIGTVNLETATVGDFSAVGDFSKRKQFAINLTGCTPGIATAQTYFEPDTYTDMTTGNLIVADLSATPTGAAGGVQLRLRNEDFSAIDLSGGSADDQNSAPVNLVGTGATLKYWVEYVSTAAVVTPGKADSIAKFTMVYL